MVVRAVLFNRWQSVRLALALLHAWGCAPAQEAAHPPAVREPSPSAELADATDEARAHDDGGVAWKQHDLGQTCVAPPGEPELLSPVEHPLVVLTSEAEYVRYACKASTIDWSRFRLVVISVHVTREELLLEGVARDGAGLVVTLRYSGVCEPIRLSYDVMFIAVLIPAGDEKVWTVRLNGPDTC